MALTREGVRCAGGTRVGEEPPVTSLDASRQERALPNSTPEPAHGGVESPLARVLAFVARAANGGTMPPAQLGEVTLLPHQRTAIPLLERALRRFGGALLADEPGLGKTFTALGVARRYRHVLVVAPATLRTMWRDALRRTGFVADFVSHQQLSRPRASFSVKVRPDLVIVDEAHHARNPATFRYAALARLTWGAHVLNLSATPIHNRRGDLHALIALFLGSGVRSLPDSALAPLIVRRSAAACGASSLALAADPHADRTTGADRALPIRPPSALLPELRRLEWIDLPPSQEVVAALLALPPPLPTADGGSAGALVALSLLRAWCSSDAALLAALRRRVATALSLEHALAGGVLPTKAGLRAWTTSNDVLQLAFPAFADGTPAGEHVSAWREVLCRHAEALRALRALVAGPGARDSVRFARLTEAIAPLLSARVVVFTHSAESAHAAFRALAPTHRVAALTGRGGRIASGPVTRRALLDAFRPEGTGIDNAAAARLDVLVATDVLSEGVDLQGAGAVVHLDLPWTPARLEQRVGRIRRIGAPRRHVVQLAVGPPLRAEEMRAVAHHLALKAGVTGALLGAGDLARVLPPLGDPAAPRGAAPTEAIERIRTLCAAYGWEGGAISDAAMGSAGFSLVAAAVAPVTPPREPSASLAARPPLSEGCSVQHRPTGVVVVRRHHALELLALFGEVTSDDPRDVLSLLERVGHEAPVAEDEYIACIELAQRWCAARDVEERALAAIPARTPAHRAMLRQLAVLVTRSGRMGRATLAESVHEARSLVLTSAGAGAEEALRTLLASAPPATTPLAWLAAVRETLAVRDSHRGAANAPPPPLAHPARPTPHSPPTHPTHPVAILLLPNK